MNKKPVIGLLGGIGSGKSSVASILGDLGCAVIDADQLAREVMDDKDIVDTVKVVFGPEILTSDGTINRAKLAENVFSDMAMLERLTAIIHPPVLKQTERLLAEYLAAPSVSAVVLDVPLLMEANWHKRCDILVFVESELSIRQQRVKRNGRFSADQIKKRENFQISLEKKKEIAQYSIQNNSDLSDLAGQVAQVYSAIMKNRGV
jgi:dephospho-CoA kinase